VNNKEKID